MAVGSIRGVSFNKIPFSVLGSSKPALPVSKFEKKSEPYWGGNLVTSTLVAKDFKSIDIVIKTAEDYEALKGVCDSLEPVDMLVIDINGTAWTALGQVTPTADFVLSDGKATVSCISDTNEWIQV